VSSPITQRPVVALAGRRIDPPDAPVRRFPLPAVDAVREAITATFRALDPVALVCGGACGADLVALEAAERLGIPAHIVLPFAPAEFRRTSVIDRPGDWGPLFDTLVAHAAQAGRLRVMDDAGAGDDAYVAANRAMIGLAGELAAGGPATAMLVWDGRRPGADITADFGEQARAAGFGVVEVMIPGRSPSGKYRQEAAAPLHYDWSIG
jgi:hypothetical protein